ncbi:ABC transporter permease [Microcystis wesenbergii FACHB-1317]|uniref:ABC transporter permease n=1 Tax=Microcystis TaxID=1125 RepID=UPI0016813833|nr:MULTISPECIES: ABC transporter permease [Microcystis]MBD2289129.1 ABC transporter permease [Microcystis wesenbergii FACHB-1317]UZO78374.1 ABC transporter permease [Microcystis aeruginosa str. Chao 1910]
MKIFDYWQIASQNLLKNKLRSSLTMLGIIVGNASVITLFGIGQGTQNLVTQQFQSLGTNVLFVVPDVSDGWGTTYQKPRSLVLEDARAIATQVPAVSGVAPEIQSTEVANYGSKTFETTAIGTTPEYLSVRNFDVAKGRFLNESDIESNNLVVTLGPELATKLFNQENPLNQYVRIRNIDFRVIGVMKPKGSVLGTNLDDVAMIPVTTMANRLTGTTSSAGIELSFISFSARDKTRVEAALFQVRNLLRQRHQAYDFSIQTQKDLSATADRIASALTLFLVAIASISLFVGGIGIMNIMLISVSERTSEIGLRKAVGASGRQILMQFLIEAVILSVLGGSIGAFVGVGGNILVASFTPLKASISPLVIALTLGVSGSIGLFFGVAPARQAARLDPIVALRSI